MFRFLTSPILRHTAPLVVGLASLMVLAPAAIANRIESWRFDDRQNRLEFSTDVGVQPRAQLIFNPTRLVIDLPGIRLGQPLVNQTIGSGAFRTLRVGQFNRQTTRIVIELAPGYTLDPSEVKFRGTAANRWAVTLPEPQRTTAQPGPTRPTPPATPPPRDAATQLEDIRVTADGLFLKTRGAAPNVELRRTGDRRVIEIDLANTAANINLIRRPPSARQLGILQLTVNQVPNQPPLTRIQLQVDADAPNWRATVSNLGGVVLLPLRRPVALEPGPLPGNDTDQPTPSGGTPGNNQPQVIPVPPAPPPVRPQPTPIPQPRARDGRQLVVIDPGHGGRDPGAVGIGGLQEKRVIFPISQEVARILERQGIRVVMTRTDDREVGLRPRVNLANQVNATLFVSIHANAISMSRPDVNGVETYYYVTGRGLAASIQRSILESITMRDRGVKRARFYVLRNTRMPSALVEVGFVTGRDDAPRLADPRFRQQMAEAIARGILRYLNGG